MQGARHRSGRSDLAPPPTTAASIIRRRFTPPPSSSTMVIVNSVRASHPHRHLCSLLDYNLPPPHQAAPPPPRCHHDWSHHQFGGLYESSLSSVASRPSTLTTPNPNPGSATSGNDNDNARSSKRQWATGGPSMMHLIAVAARPQLFLGRSGMSSNAI